jgi:hypothetical protein
VRAAPASDALGAPQGREGVEQIVQGVIARGKNATRLEVRRAEGGEHQRLLLGPPCGALLAMGFRPGRSQRKGAGVWRGANAKTPRRQDAKERRDPAARTEVLGAPDLRDWETWWGSRHVSRSMG